MLDPYYFLCKMLDPYYFLWNITIRQYRTSMVV